jgi:hypothetical protein
MTKHSEHYPTFIEHPDDPEKRSLVKTPWAHHKQLLGWGLEGLTPEPEPPANDPSLKPVHDPVYPKWIENPKTKSRKLVPNAKAEADQLEAWGIDPDDEDEELEPVKPGYSGPTPLDQILPPARSNSGMAAGSTTVRPSTREERRAAARKQKEADAAAGRK